MIYILNIETTTKNCSVSIFKNEHLLIVKEQATENFSHAEKLHIFIQETLQNCNLQINKLSAIAVSQGPGSYTGLRIGISTAKGLCYALNIPLIAVDTLAVLAHQIKIKNGLIVSMLDARRMEVFVSFFDKKYIKIRETQSEIINEESYTDITDTLHLIGDGAIKLQTTLTHKKFQFYPNIMYPSAREMGKLAFHKYKISDFADVAYFEPFYLKDFILNR